MTNALVSITAPDGSSLGDNVQVDTDGIAEFFSCQIGTFDVQVEAVGFIAAATTIEVGCEQRAYTLQRLVSLSPELQAGETRIIMSWETNQPLDLDIHVISVRNSNQSDACRTFYGNLDGCTEISQDTDNFSGGNSGAETMTLLDNSINKDFTYLIGIEDYGSYGVYTNFIQSGAKITITNGVTTEVIQMVAGSVPIDPNEYTKFDRS